MRRFDHIDLRVRSLAECRFFYETLLPALGFDRDARTEGWLQFERSSTGRIAEFFGVTESKDHVANECRIAFWASSVAEIDEHALIIGAHFRPGGAFPFFNLPVSELADSHVELETLWGASAVELRERLCAARTPAERFSLLENALTARLFRRPESHYAVRFALNVFTPAESELTIASVTQRIGLSPRRFIQVFKLEVGMSPKLFCRVRRFQHLLESVREQAAPNWARLASECGYFDQSHFIHDFRIFSGLTPTEYVRQRSERVLPNHVPLLFR
jgi:AraC-like DNA-binding protein